MKKIPEPTTYWLCFEDNKHYQIVGVYTGTGKLSDQALVCYRDPLTGEIFAQDFDEWHFNFIEKA